MTIHVKFVACSVLLAVLIFISVSLSSYIWLSLFWLVFLLVPSNHRYFLWFYSPTLLLLTLTYDFNSDSTQIDVLSPLSGLQTHFPPISIILTVANFICLILNSSLHITRSSLNICLSLFFFSFWSSYHQILEALKTWLLCQMPHFPFAPTLNHLSSIFHFLSLGHSMSSLPIYHLASLDSY